MPAPASPSSARACSGWPGHDTRRPAPARGAGLWRAGPAPRLRGAAAVCACAAPVHRGPGPAAGRCGRGAACCPGGGRGVRPLDRLGQRPLRGPGQRPRHPAGRAGDPRAQPAAAAGPARRGRHGVAVRAAGAGVHGLFDGQHRLRRVGRRGGPHACAAHPGGGEPRGLRAARRAAGRGSAGRAGRRRCGMATSPACSGCLR